MEPNKPKPQRKSVHDPGGTIGGLAYWDPLFRPGQEYWRPINEAARLLVRMNLAFWMGSAAIGIGKRTQDLAEKFVARCQLITSLCALHRAIYHFHKLILKTGDAALIAKEGPLFEQLQQVAPHNGPMKTMRDRIAAHVDHLLEAQDDDLASICADIYSFNTKMEDVLLATERYMRFAWHAEQDDWATPGQQGQSIHLVQKTLGPLIVGDDHPEKVPGGPGLQHPSTFMNDLHEAHASDKTPEQTAAEVGAALAKERERLKSVAAHGRETMIPPNTDAATLAEIDRLEAEILKRRIDECEQRARDYKP